MTDELDTIYLRARDSWEADPAAFEKDQPLLARAFNEAQPNTDLAAAYGQLKRDRDQEQMAHEANSRDLGATISRLQRHVQDLRAREKYLVIELSTAENTIREHDQPSALAACVAYEPDEAEQLAELGWRKAV